MSDGSIDARHARASAYTIAGLMIVFAIAVLLVNPRGNFPLNDDWNFALATWWFSEHGFFRFARATAMSLRAQVVWGALWTRLFGESFEVLRASTLLLSIGTVLVLERLLRQCGVASTRRAIVSLALLFHPIYFWSSFTYMTEVPFVCASVIAFYFFARSYLSKNLAFLGGGVAFVLLSCWIRQTGIANAVAPILLILVMREKWHPRWRVALAIAAMPVVVFVSLFLLTGWFEGYPEEVAMHYAVWKRGSAVTTALGLVASRIAENSQYAALFFLPLVIPLFSWLGRNRARWLLWLTCIAVVVPVASARVALGEPMPYRTFGNVLVNLGLGPLTLRDTWVFGYRLPSHLATVPRLAITIVAVAGGGLLLALILTAARRAGSATDDRGAISGLAALHGLAATLVLAASPFYFDRYALDSLWSFSVVAALSLTWRARRTLTAAGLVAGMALFSIVYTAEYLAWNRARWEAFSWLTSRGVALQQLDGGYEINQYLIGGFDGRADIGKFQFSVLDDEYVITLNEVRGYSTMHTIPYRRILRRTGTVFVQRRTTGFTPEFELPDHRVATGGGRREA